MKKLKKMKKSKRKVILPIIIALIVIAGVLLFLSCKFNWGLTDAFPFANNESEETSPVSSELPDQGEQSSSSEPVLLQEPETVTPDKILSLINDFDGKKPFCEVNGNIPFFSEDQLTTEPFEKYSPLDPLGRCGVAFANVCLELMPTGEREDFSFIKPTGWNQVIYGCIKRGALYNRSHLIAFQLAGENANDKNLITGTDYLNHDGMIQFENKVADCVKQNDYHVLYRVTPVFKDDELVSRGVLMEAYSVEDKGESVCYCVFCYNVQPGVEINYKTGESKEIPPEEISENETEESEELKEYVLNSNKMKFHLPECQSVSEMSSEHKDYFVGTRNELVKMGYEPCESCNP